MRFEVQREKSIKSEPVVRFRLQEKGDGVNLLAAEPNGDEWHVLRLEPGKPMLLYDFVSDHLGLLLTDGGQVKTTGTSR